MEQERRFSSSRIFQTLSDNEVQSILDLGRAIEVPASNRIFRLGEPGDTMLVIVSGTIRLQFPPPRDAKDIGAGEVFGELALIHSEHRRSATAIAIEDTTLIEISRDAFDRLVDSHPRLLMKLLRVVSRNLLDAERELVDELASKNRELRQVLDYLQRTRQELSAQELLARTDELTGLYNRRCFNDQLERFVARADEEGIGLALLMIDLDEFKAINDRFGHSTGDAALVHVAGLVRSQVRRTDLPCRMGGDEFAILLLDIEPADARARGGDLIGRFASSSFGSIPEGAPVTVEASIGGTMREPSESADDLLYRADRLLYEAKSAGRGRLCWAGEMILPAPKTR